MVKYRRWEIKGNWTLWTNNNDKLKAINNKLSRGTNGNLKGDLMMERYVSGCPLEEKNTVDFEVSKHSWVGPGSLKQKLKKIEECFKEDTIWTFCDYPLRRFYGEGLFGRSKKSIWDFLLSSFASQAVLDGDENFLEQEGKVSTASEFCLRLALYFNLIRESNVAVPTVFSESGRRVNPRVVWVIINPSQLLLSDEPCLETLCSISSQKMIEFLNENKNKKNYLSMHPKLRVDILFVDSILTASIPPHLSPIAVIWDSEMAIELDQWLNFYFCNFLKCLEFEVGKNNLSASVVFSEQNLEQSNQLQQFERKSHFLIAQFKFRKLMSRFETALTSRRNFNKDIFNESEMVYDSSEDFGDSPNMSVSLVWYKVLGTRPVRCMAEDDLRGHWESVFYYFSKLTNLELHRSIIHDDQAEQIGECASRSLLAHLELIPRQSEEWVPFFLQAGTSSLPADLDCLSTTDDPRSLPEILKMLLVSALLSSSLGHSCEAREAFADIILISKLPISNLTDLKQTRNVITHTPVKQRHVSSTLSVPSSLPGQRMLKIGDSDSDLDSEEDKDRRQNNLHMEQKKYHDTVFGSPDFGYGSKMRNAKQTDSIYDASDDSTNKSEKLKRKNKKKRRNRTAAQSQIISLWKEGSLWNSSSLKPFSLSLWMSVAKALETLINTRKMEDQIVVHKSSDFMDGVDQLFRLGLISISRDSSLPLKLFSSRHQLNHRNIFQTSNVLFAPSFASGMSCEAPSVQMSVVQNHGPALSHSVPLSQSEVYRMIEKGSDANFQKNEILHSWQKDWQLISRFSLQMDLEEIRTLMRAMSPLNEIFGC